MTNATQTITYGRAEWCSPFSDTTGVLLDQVEKRIEEDPDQIDEVPVEPGELDPEVVVRAVVAVHGAVEDDAEHRHSHQHVQPVQAGHEEVERPVHGRAGKVDLLVPVEAAGQLVLVEMRGVLDRLAAE